MIPPAPQEPSDQFRPIPYDAEGEEGGGLEERNFKHFCKWSNWIEFSWRKRIVDRRRTAQFPSSSALEHAHIAFGQRGIAQ
jgi:hypothetical protein